MTAAAAGAPADHPDRALGYFHPLNTYDVAWLASEVRLQHQRRRTVERDAAEAEARLERDRLNLRHILAHQAAETVVRRVSGRYRQEGAARVVEMIYPIGRCPDGCDGRA